MSKRERLSTALTAFRAAAFELRTAWEAFYSPAEAASLPEEIKDLYPFIDPGHTPSSYNFAALSRKIGHWADATADALGSSPRS